MAVPTEAIGLADAREVSETNATLEQCIAAGSIPPPDLMEFNPWQQWRKADGKRPLMKTDGMTTTPRQEADLWRKTMQDLYGPDW